MDQKTTGQTGHDGALRDLGTLLYIFTQFPDTIKNIAIYEVSFTIIQIKKVIKLEASRI